MRNLFVVFILFNTFLLNGQDTLNVVHYNLLNYGNITSYCHNGNNNINDKDAYLKTIINYLKPDIFTVNEISKSESIHQHLLDQVLNTSGVDYYEKANFIKVAESDLVNMLYYNKDKLALHSHMIAQSYIRDIDVYKLFYLSDDLDKGDTAFVICVVAHLKSSSGSTNENKRKVMAENTMNYLNEYDDDNNYLMMGDFNLYSNTEDAYQQFLYYSNTSLRFGDPVDQYGEWHNNSYYSDYHTQSTHATSNGCASYGGMDDRFDFILISNSIKNGTKTVQYINDTYWAVGQDGHHYNKSVNSLPTNTSVPSDVLDALAYNSDHLPVFLKLFIDKTLDVQEIRPDIFDHITMINPANNYLDLKIDVKERCELKLGIYNVFGNLLIKNQIQLQEGDNQISTSIQWLKPGLYIVQLKDENSNTVVLKLLKK